jgi:hypothetical protein
MKKVEEKWITHPSRSPSVVVILSTALGWLR